MSLADDVRAPIRHADRFFIGGQCHLGDTPGGGTPCPPSPIVLTWTLRPVIV